MVWHVVPLDPAITIGDPGIGSDNTGGVVGGPPQWADDSDATYAYFYGTYFGEGEPQFSGAAGVAVASDAEPLPPTTRVRVRVRLSTSGVGGRMPGFRFRENVSGGTNVTISPSDMAPTSAGWFDYEFDLDDGQRADFAAVPNEWRLDVLAAIYPAGSVPTGNQRWDVYEVRLEAQVRGDAPPCRKFPRSDGLGVGSGRRYPPSKSQQRSGRRFGYY